MSEETQSYRSWVMGRVRSRDTSPEIRVRSIMHHAGYRYRLHVGDMPGKPDIVLPRHHIVAFINGCFWHRHPGCRYASMPKTNLDYWQRKFYGNVARDQKAHSALLQDGWEVLVIWECQTRNRAELEGILASVLPAR